METGNEQLAKSLVDLIDETLEEIEELKKSKFAASEISIEGPGEGIAGKPTDGELDAKKADKDEDKDDKDKDDADNKDKDMEKADMEKAMEKMDEVAKMEMYKMYMDKDKDKDDEDKDKEVKKGTNEQSDPGAVHKSSDADTKPIQELKPATEEFEKSVDTRFSSLEGKISDVAELIKKLGDTPSERKSVAAGTQVDTLKKNDNEIESLSKSQILGEMWKMKEDGKTVLSEHFAQIETGSTADAQEIAHKYDIK